MLKTLRSLIGVHHKGDATAAEIEAALAGAHAEIEAADRAHADADAAYRAGLLRLDGAELEKLIGDKQTATVRRDRAAALAEALAGRLADARATDVQAERRAVYDAAARAQASAAKMLATEYPKHARALVAVLRTVAEADELARSANQALPDGCERLRRVEHQVRSEPNVPSRVTTDVVIEAWCMPSGSRVHPNDLDKIKPDTGGRTGTWKPFGADPIPVTLRRFRRVTTIPEAIGRSVPPLASVLRLPGLRAAHTPFWEPGMADGHGGIVAGIDAAEPHWGQAREPAVIFDPEPQTETIPLDEPADRAA